VTRSADPRCTAPGTIRETTDNFGTRGLEAVFWVAVPPDELLEILWDVANFGRLFPDITEARIVDQDGETPSRRLDVAYRVDAVVKEIRYVLRRNLDPDSRVITWREVSGDLRRVRGGWWVEATGDPETSRATYRAFVDIGRFVPTRLVAKGAKRKAKEMIARVRRVAGEIHASRET
jgi:ribosome-associated toxin RatA of RatAB toxin-antitoxin module